MNAAFLAGTAAWLWHARHPPPPLRPVSDARSTHLPAAPANASPNRLPQDPGPARKALFDWRQVESPNYKEYLANLRAIGCPEKTIKEIITADVKDLFAMRRAAVTQTNHYEYWRATPVTLSADQRQQLQALTAERGEVLNALGIASNDWADLLQEFYRGDFESKNLELEFLPEPKRQALKDLLYQMGEKTLAAGDDHTKQGDIEEKGQAAIQSLLTSEELHDYELRTSVPAAQLRFVLQELEPSEEEFRSIYDSWNALNTHTHGSPEYRAAQQTSEAALRAMLGPERLALYLAGVKKLNY